MFLLYNATDSHQTRALGLGYTAGPLCFRIELSEKTIGRDVTYVHTQNPRLVQFVHNLLRRYTHCTHKQLGLFFNDDIDEIVEIAFGVIIIGLAGCRAKRREEEVDAEC